ncbi:MAG: hypothetical protein ACTSW4_00850 [Candidatus Ranarchaeia archaeon]
MCPQKNELEKQGGNRKLSSRQLFGIVDEISFQYVQQHIKKQPPLLTELFGDQIQTRVIQLLLQLDQINFKAIYLLKAAQLLQVSHSSIDRVLRPLLENGYILETGVGRRRYFRLNLRNPTIQHLKDFYMTTIKKQQRQMRNSSY